MSNVVLTLGGVAFQDMEIPEKIMFGGKQRIVVQNLIGGGRTVEVLGIDDGNISFSGIFSGSDAAERAQTLDAVRALGVSLPLIWNSFFYTVIIENLSIEYCKINWIPFSITCVVVNDPLTNLTTAVAPVASLIASDLTIATALSGQAGVSLEGLSATSIAGFTALQGTLNSAINSGGALLNSANASLNLTTNASSAASTINSLNATSSQLAGLAQMKGYVDRSLGNF